MEFPLFVWLDVAARPRGIRYPGAGGIRTHHLEAGTGTRDILIFLDSNAEYLEAHLRKLPVHLDRYRAIALDMIGHGYTDNPDRLYRATH
jgi:2-hydroxy-6-oxonona-2,4-dienedioate hydrolase